METKTVYQTDYLSYLIGTIELNSNEDQGRSGDWRIPAWCVDKKPLKEKEGYRLRWIDNKWINEKVPDFEEEAELTFEAKKELKSAEISAKAKEMIFAGFEYEIEGISYKFSYDEEDQRNFSKANSMALLSLLTHDVTYRQEWRGWKGRRSKVFSLTAQDYLNLSQAGGVHQIKYQKLCWNLQEQFFYVKNDDELESIRWPKN